MTRVGAACWEQPALPGGALPVVDVDMLGGGMRLYYDLDRESFVTAAGYSAPAGGFSCKVSSIVLLDIEFSRSGVAVDLGGGWQLRYGLKEDGKYEGDLLALAETVDFTKVSGETGRYTAELNLNTAGIKALLNVDGDDGSNDEPSVTVMGQMDWRNDPGDSWSKSPTQSVVIHNSVLNDTDGMEDDPVPPYPLASDVVAYTDQSALGKTAAEKDQACDNIGAAKAADVAALINGLDYQGAWDASTNTPAIPAAAAGNKNHFYVVGTAGTTNIDGETDWGVGDWLISNGTVWQKIDNSERDAATLLALIEGESGVDLSSLPVLTVADNAAKLALTDVAVGQVVIITGEGNRPERYLGDISGDDSGLHIDTAHTDVGGNTFGGYYYKYASNEWRKQGANPYAQRLYINGPNWALSADVSDNFTIAKTGSNPWDEVGTWTGPGGKTIPASAVTKAPVATEANWATVQHAPAEGAFADGDKDKLDDAVTKSDAQTVTGQKTHTADIRISHDPDNDDAVLPRRMMDGRYRNPNMSLESIDIWDDFVCDGTSTGIGLLPWKVSASSVRVGPVFLGGEPAFGSAEISTAASQGSTAYAASFYSTITGKNQIAPRVLAAEFLWRFAVSTLDSSVVCGFNFYDTSGAVIMDGSKRSWGVYAAKPASAWVASTAYSVGDFARPTTSNGLRYKCTVAGTSAASEPTWPTASAGDTVTDGGVTWELDSLDGHANFQLVSGKAGLPAPTYLGCKALDSGIPVTANAWHTLRIRLTSGSSAQMQVDSGSDVTVPLDIIQALEAGPAMVVRADTSTAAKLYLDAWGASIPTNRTI